MTGLRWGVRTDIGQLRSVNQDNVYAQAPLFAVADGMGGAAAGDVASRVALDALVEVVAPAPDDPTRTTLESLVAGVRNANRVVFERSLNSVELRGMGTTICALALIRSDGEDRLCVVNVGDSRGYVVQDGELVQITRDHSYVEDLVEAGEITREQARFHPKKNIVTRVLGVDPDVEVDAWEVVPFPGDRYLLCSDGLFNEVDDDDVVGVLTGEPDPQQAADELTRRANASGGHDNISVVVVDVTADDVMAAAPGSTQTLPAVDADGTGDGPDTTTADPDATTTVPVTEPAPAAPAPPTTPTPAGASKPKPAAAAPTRRRRRRVSGRAVGFVVLVLAIAAVAVGAIGYYGRTGYFVAFKGDNVAIYKGRPGGLLWLNPTVETTFPLTRVSVPEDQVARLDDGYTFEERRSADAYVANITEQAEELAAATSTTTTTAPPPTTTTVPPGTTLPPEGQVVTTIPVATTAPVTAAPETTAAAVVTSGP